MSDSLSERPKRDAAKKASAWNRSILIILFIPMPLAYIFFRARGTDQRTGETIAGRR